MSKVIFSIVCLLLFVAPLLGQQYRFDPGEQKHIRAFLPKKKSNVSPQIRKCLNVKCQEGFYCFHGRCIKLDNACLNLKCPQGFRCREGKCQKQLHRPKKVVCPPLGFNHQKRKCDDALQKQCLIAKISQVTCGFNPWNNQYHDYLSPCDACADEKSKIRFFYEVDCSDAPRICDTNEECMNGVCTTMFDDAAFQNSQACNDNSECKANEFCAAHKCIDKRDVYNFLDSKGESDAILIKIA